MNGNTDKLGALPSVIPNCLKFAVPRQGPPGTRKEFKLPAESTTYASNSNNIVRFFFTNSDIIDFSRGGIAFDVTITAPGATYVRVAQGIWSIFNRVRLTTGQELEDIREYNRLHSVLFEATREPDVGAVLGSVYGYGTQSERNTWGATPNKDYMMPLLCGLFLSSPLPMEVFTSRLQLELYLANPLTCIESDCPNPNQITITLSNIYFHYEVLNLSEPTRTSFISNAMSGSRYPYKSFVYYTQNITGATSDIAIPHASSAIDAFVNFMIDSDTQNKIDVNNKFLTWNKNNCLEHTLRINNEFYPVEPCQANEDPQSYLMYLRWVEKWRIGGTYNNPPTISFEDYNDDRFLIIYQMETYPGESLVNQLSTQNAGNNIFLRLKLSATPGTPQQLITFVQITRTIDLIGTKLRQ